MPRRGDNIRKRKDGRWEARFPKDDDGNHSKRYCSVYGKTYQEAKEKRDHILKHGRQKKLPLGQLYSEMFWKRGKTRIGCV